MSDSPQNDEFAAVLRDAARFRALEKAQNVCGSFVAHEPLAKLADRLILEQQQEKTT